jgi:phosphatidylserine/phosphatidylglycerophosphate/cardiolipin synthase-like enzyme
MIYVHSKGMIVDDEYIIRESANINQSSMNGSPNTENAIGRAANPTTHGAHSNFWERDLRCLEDMRKLYRSKS